MSIIRKIGGFLGITGSPSRANAFDANGNFYLGSGSIPPGSALTSGVRNFLWGSRAGGQITSASDNIVMGLDAGLFITAGGSSNANPSVYLGYQAGKSVSEGGNVGIGPLALGPNSSSNGTSVYSAVAIGDSALYSVTASQKDAAVGSDALKFYLRGGQNAVFGRGGGTNLIEGSYNSMMGHTPMFYNVYSTESVAIGDQAGNYWNATAPLAKFTASISGTTMTVTAVSSGTILPATSLVSLTGTALSSVAQIQAYGTGGTTGVGGTGTYALSANLGTVTSQTIWAGPGGTNNVAIGTLTGPTGYNDSYTIAIGNSTTTGAGDHRTAIGNGQAAAYISGDFCQYTTPDTINNAAGQTWTAAQVRGGLITRKGANAVSDTTPTAAQIVAAIPGCEVGSSIVFRVRNLNTGLLTILAGSGVTLDADSTTTIATVFTREYLARVTNATASSEAVTLYGISTAAN